MGCITIYSRRIPWLTPDRTFLIRYFWAHMYKFRFRSTYVRIFLYNGNRNVTVDSLDNKLMTVKDHHVCRYINVHPHGGILTWYFLSIFQEDRSHGWRHHLWKYLIFQSCTCWSRGWKKTRMSKSWAQYPGLVSNGFTNIDQGKIMLKYNN